MRSFGILPSGRPTRRWRGWSVCLALVAILHTGWFLFGWVPFHPRCSYDVGVSPFSTGEVTLIGDLDPTYVVHYEKALTEIWGRAAVWRAGAHTVLVGPVFGLLYSADIEDVSYRVAGVTDIPLLGDESKEPCRTVERKTMAGGQVDAWGREWGVWPWETLSLSDFAQWLRGLYR